MKNTFFILLLLTISLNATEIIWDGSGSMSEAEFNKAIKEYVDKKYPEKVRAYELEKVRERERKSIDKGSYIKPALVYIKAGSFIMGSNSGYKDEKPTHKVTIQKDFYIGKYEVTFKEYDKFCDDTNREKPKDEGWGRGDRPVINVNWNDAKAYTKWLSKKTGKRYRPPTDSEWEFVARAGTSTKYSFGDNDNQLDSYAWYKNNSYHKTHEVGQKQPNPWGVYDMHGNACEWCEDSYNNTPKDGSVNSSGKQRLRVIRGGSWGDISSNLRSAVRVRSFPQYALSIFGFRLLQEL